MVLIHVAFLLAMAAMAYYFNVYAGKFTMIPAAGLAQFPKITVDVLIGISVVMWFAQLVNVVK